MWGVIMQLAFHLWHHRCLAVLERYGISWKGSWSLASLPGVPGVFAPCRESLSLAGKGTFGKMYL